MNNDVVITGMGIVSPLGTSVAEFRERLFAGESGVIDVRGKAMADDTPVAQNFPVPFCAMVDRSKLGTPSILRSMNPKSVPGFWKFALNATEEALEAVPAGVSFDGIVYGSAEGISYELITESFRKLDEKSFDYDSTRSETSLRMIAKLLKERGNGNISDANIISINSACASGNQAIGLAAQRIRAGLWKRAIVGGVDARCNISNLMNFHMLGAVTTAEVPAATASRPFSKDRSGFVRGEGAATLVLETRQEAEARGAKILAVVAGYGNTSDAYRLTDGRDDGASVIRAMEWALEDARLPKNMVDYINAHGTSTPLNDRLETKAIKEVFGERAYKIPVSSLKSQIGHSTVAAGALEAVACVLMLQEQKISPTINYNVPDPECDLDYVPNKSREARINTILSNNFGFGGQNACLVFKGASV